MEGTKESLWVTSAVFDKDVEAALTTCHSLRRVYTTRKIAVIASHQLSFNSRQALNHGFDFVFYLDEDLNVADLELDNFAKLFSFLALQSFNNCVYVSPLMLALKSCDDIFSHEADTIVMCNTDNNLSVFLFQPSANRFDNIVSGLKEIRKIGLKAEFNLKTFLQNQSKEVLQLDEKYNILIEPGKPLIGYKGDICMVNLKHIPNDSNMNELKEAGILEGLIANYGFNIRNIDVLPLLNPSSTLKENSFAFTRQKEAIAIVGMSCRFPGSNNLEEFWNLLFEGEDGTRTPPPFRWLSDQNLKRVADSKGTNAGFLNTSVDEFDAKFFGISPKEALFMDPQHRLMHELIWEGLEDACIDPTTLHGTSGSIFMGSWTNDYKDILNHAGIQDFYRKYMGNSIGAATARLSFLLGLTGPSIATESGCSAAMVAVHLACKSLLNGETNLALVGGVNLLLRPYEKDILPMVLSPDGRSKTFSEDANGFARAEGCGVLVLKRFSDAVKDNDNIWALIRGSAIAQEGVSTSIGTPTRHCESLAMKMALKNAEVCASQVSYVETHGTGTIVGDPLEVAAIAKAYHSPNRTKPLIIGSVKTNVGHAESCSGITGIIKTVLCMHHEIIPAHRNFTKLNPAIDLEAIPAILPLERLDWKKDLGVGERRRIAGVSSFGITGTDAHLILEEQPDITGHPSTILTLDKQVDRPLHLLKLSAKTNEALMALLDSYKGKFENVKDSFANIAYSLNTGRANFEHRVVIIASSKDQAVRCINKHLYFKGEIKDSKTTEKICFLFTGQGSQYSDMAKMLYTCSPVFRSHFDHCQKIFKDCHNINMMNVIWIDQKENQINRTIYSQTSIFCVQYALFKLWESWGIKPDFVMGHSLGEFAASVCCGILSLEDAVLLIGQRSKLIDQLEESKMLVVHEGIDVVNGTLKEFSGNDETRLLDIAAINSPSQVVVAGDTCLVVEFSNFCTERNVKIQMLSSSHAFHSKCMDPMLNDYSDVAKRVKIGKTFGECKFISGLRGDVVTSEDIDVEYWVEHTRETVKFLEASKKAVSLGCRIFIEIGPQPVLSALTMMNNDGTRITCLPSLPRNKDEWETIFRAVGQLYLEGIEIDWRGIDRFYNRTKVHILPHYPFTGKKFWPNLIKDDDTKLIHPLIGSSFPNAAQVKIYQNGLNLKTHGYIKDHVIGNTVVFPGAGYLEMCLAAGLATVENSLSLRQPKRPMKVENLLIKAPLALEDGKTCQVQTVVEFNTSMEKNHESGEDLTVKIFHRQEESSNLNFKWVEHAVATFSPLATGTAESEQLIEFDRATFIQTISQPSNEEVLRQIYDELESIGLNFGPTFKSLEKIWKGKNDKCIIAKVKVPPETDGQYIVHPAILDAMIQAIKMPEIMNINSKTKLCIPIKIGKFLWLGSPTTINSDLYIHVFENSSTLLVDSTGKVLGLMENVELIDTTGKALESVIEQQTSTMPNMWEEIWHPKLGPSQHRHDLQVCKNQKFYNTKFLNNVEQKFNRFSPKQKKIFRSLERLVYLNFVRCLYKCGWVPILGTKFNMAVLMDQLGFKSEYSKLLNYMIHVLSEEGILENVEDIWKISVLPPTLEQLEEQIKSSDFTVDLPQDFNATKLFSKLGKIYSKIVKGEQSALSILFPGEDDSASEKNWPSVVDFYKEYADMTGLIRMYSEVISAQLKSCKGHMSSGSRNVFRILEIGAGSGLLAQEYINVLKEYDLEFEYTFTDISSAFFAPAERNLKPYLKHVTFKKLNIEEDPLSQGFTPNYYEFVVSSDVLHATRDLQQSLINVRTLLKPDGGFFLGEQTKKNRFITFLFGLLEGFWRFEDVSIRKDHCTLSADQWRDTLDTAGFDAVVAFPALNHYHSLMYSFKREYGTDLLETQAVTRLTPFKYWIIFHQEDNTTSQSLIKRLSSLPNRQVIIVTVGQDFKKSGWMFTVGSDRERDFEQLMDAVQVACNTNNLEGIVYAWSLDHCSSQSTSVLKPYFYMIQSLLSRQLSINTKIICLVSGIMPIEGNIFDNLHSSTIVGFTKVLSNERPDILCKCIDIGPTNNAAGGVEQILFEMWSTDNNTQVAYDDTNTRYVYKLHSHKSTLSALKLPNGYDRFQLVLPETKSFDDLRFDTLERYNLKENQVEIQVKASALNFRDVLSVLKPTDQFKNVDVIGSDFAGVIKRVGSKESKWSVGDHVVGVDPNYGTLPSHVTVDQMDIIKIPEGWSFCEARALPAVVETSYGCLIDVAKISAADKVLIHTATGGVGLSAIQICQKIGATIYATAGSQRKRNYLKSLGIKYVFHSRNTTYGDEILKATNGRGVDVVLNSLTSDGFKEATLKVCAKNARFVEMSKLSIWTPEQVQKLRPDIQYTIFDLSAKDIGETRRLITKVEDLMEIKAIKPIPYVRFDAVHIRQALGYLQKGKHIGKVVCVMPEHRMENGSMQIYTPMFNDNGTYITTGGLGGIGFAVCQWMVDMGAKNVILAGRSAPSEILKESISNLNTSKGVNIIAVHLDVSIFSECEQLINVKINELGLPPLKGIMHAAGTLADDLIENQTWNNLSSTFKAKVDGTLNLHRLTTHLNLEHFVMFSSMVAIFGTPGQSNHSAGNNFEDTMAHYRNSLGLPAATINWGQWGEVGIATEIDLPGIKTLSTFQGLKGLEYALKSQRTQTGVFNIDSFVMLRKIISNISNILGEPLLKSLDGGYKTNTLANKNLPSDDFWERYDSLKTISAKSDLVHEKLRSLLRSILKFDDTDAIEDNTKFQSLGIDSLMFVELKNSVQVLLGTRVTVNASALKNKNTVAMLSDTLIEIIEDGVVKEERPLSPEEVNALIKEDCILPQTIHSKTGQLKIDIKDVSKVLLTGCTGMLGPYDLKELVSRPQIQQVVCLIRPRKLISGIDRLKNVLKERELLYEVDLSKVSCVTGNVAKPNLGMENSLWEELCENVDAVFHCAANVQHIEHYKKRNTDDDVRAVNIGGLKNILEFACTGRKLKRVYCGSSLLAVVTVDEFGCVSENWPESNDFDGITNLAYPISKFVGDVLMKTAVLERGIPGKVFRFPIIMGDSKTGRFVLEQNHVMLRFLFMLKNGIMPSVPYPYATLPVDICASISVGLFFNPNTPNDIFNVSNVTPDVEQEFVHVAKKLGYKVDIVEYSEFCERIRDSTSEDSPFFIFRDFYRNEDDIMSIYSKSQVLQQYILDGCSKKDFMVSKKIAKILPEFYDNCVSSMDQIYRDLLFARNKGWFAKYKV